MTLTFPLTDILSSVGIADQTFELVSRQEFSRTAYGRTIGKDLGSGLWTASYTTSIIPNDDAVAFEARLHALDGVSQPFEAFDLRRQGPRFANGAYAHGLLANVYQSRAISLSSLTPGQTVAAGDYLSFDYGGTRALHQAVESAVANESGVTPYFDVRPHLRPGWTLGLVVNTLAPRGLFTLAPNAQSSRIENLMFTQISFKAVQYL